MTLVTKVNSENFKKFQNNLQNINIKIYIIICYYKNLPCNFFSTATSIFKTCLGWRADSTFNAINSLVTRS